MKCVCVDEIWVLDILARKNNNKIMRIMTNTQGVKKEYYGNFKAPYFL